MSQYERLKPDELAQYSQFDSDWAVQVNHSVIPEIGTQHKYTEEDIARVDPYKDDVCEYYNQYKNVEANNAPVGTDTHRAVVSWAENNCSDNDFNSPNN